VWRIVPHRKGFATRGYACRACLYIGLYAYCQYRWIWCRSTIPVAVAYGIAKAWIGLNVQHDANHGSISADRPYINRLLGLFADGIGGSQWLWNQQHWTHHAYTNDAQNDPDANAGRPFLRLHDEQPSRPWHRFQTAYLFFILALYWLAEVWNPNVWFAQKNVVVGVRDDIDDQSKASGFWHRQRRNTVQLRIIYIAIHFGVPIYYHGVVIGLSHCLILGATGSLLLAGLFTLSHNFVGANRHPRRLPSTETAEDNDGESLNKKALPCWYRLQVETSCTYGGRYAGYLTGGLNYQIEHHLFPRLNSAWYPYISPTVRDVCRRHGVRYTYFASLYHNAVSSYTYIRAAGGDGSGTNTEDDERRQQQKKKVR
jgi:acyl-lipid (7-3)-desaturase (Delta-4 desaturase)